MDALIASTLEDLLKSFAISMASNGHPNKAFMVKKLKALCDEAAAQRDRRIIMLVKGEE